MGDIYDENEEGGQQEAPFARCKDRVGNHVDGRGMRIQVVRWNVRLSRLTGPAGTWVSINGAAIYGRVAIRDLREIRSDFRRRSG